MKRANRYIVTFIYLVTCLSFFLPEFSVMEATEIEITGKIGGRNASTEPPEEGKPALPGPKEEYAKPKTKEMKLNRLPQLGGRSNYQTYFGEYLVLVALLLIFRRCLAIIRKWLLGRSN